MAPERCFDSPDAGVGLLELPPPVRRGRRRRRGRPRGDGGPPPPPDDGDGGGGGGDGSGGEGEGPGEPDARGSGALGLGLLLSAVTTLFLVFLGAFVLMRKNAPEWPPSDAPAPPLGLWVSTLILLASSLTMSRAVAAARREERSDVGRWLAVTLALGALFLAVQAKLWGGLSTSGFLPSTSGYGAIFYALTGLHAAHIAGGLVYAALVLVSVRRRRDPRPAGSAVPLCAVYWHFMGGLWVVLFAALCA